MGEIGGGGGGAQASDKAGDGETDHGPRACRQGNITALFHGSLLSSRRPVWCKNLVCKTRRANALEIWSAAWKPHQIEYTECQSRQCAIMSRSLAGSLVNQILDSNALSTYPWPDGHTRTSYWWEMAQNGTGNRSATECTENLAFWSLETIQRANTFKVGCFCFSVLYFCLYHQAAQVVQRCDNPPHSHPFTYAHRLTNSVQTPRRKTTTKARDRKEYPRSTLQIRGTAAKSKETRETEAARRTEEN